MPFVPAQRKRGRSFFLDAGNAVGRRMRIQDSLLNGRELRKEAGRLLHDAYFGGYLMIFQGAAKREALGASHWRPEMKSGLPPAGGDKPHTPEKRP